MAYRQISTATWQDPWFEQLSPKAKLLFLYLWTNDVCNQAGLFQISQRRIEFEVGFRIDDVIAELKAKVEWFPVENIVWVKNFFKWQCCNSSFVRAAVAGLGNIPKSIVEKFITHNSELLKKHGVDTEAMLDSHGAGTVSPPSPQGADILPPPSPLGVDTVASSVTVTETETVITPPIVPPFGGDSRVSRNGFDAFWDAYPRKVGKLAAQKAWKKLKTPASILPKILEAIDRQRASPQWTKEGGQFIPHPATWLNQGRWEDDVTAGAESESEKALRLLREEQG
jgi:hypothetical protein